jgi:hypothetical protein
MADSWYIGNADDDADQHRGWLVGYFVDPAHGAVRVSDDVEVKWGVHQAGDQRAEWTSDDQRTTVLMLISGRFRLDLTLDTVILDRPGDYVVWGPGVDHSWFVEDDSVTVTIRWPSLGG